MSSGGISDPLGLMKKEFTCPKCGSHFFRTVNQMQTPWKRQCKGHYLGNYGEYKGCSFTWLDDEDDKHIKDKTD